MKYLRTLQASPTHQAKWYSCTLSEVEQMFGRKAINTLINGLANGVTSVNNLSSQIQRGVEQYVDITLLLDYHEWKEQGKPIQSLAFHLVKFTANSNHEVMTNV